MTDSRRKRWIVGGLGAFAVVGAWIAWAQVPISGEIFPPDGTVQNTTPSLAELEDQLDRIEANGGGIVPVDGWETAFFGPAGGSSQLTAIPIAPGRVFVHRIVAHQGGVVAFDGAGGQIALSGTGIGLPTSGTPIARVYGFTGSSGSAGQTADLEVNVVAENGLQLAYINFGSGGAFQVFYKSLD
ncbi:MAG: hypothetical protein AAGK04_00155 [Planctomycetota bacterium]